MEPVQVDNAAKLITAIAAILAALAWPAVLLTALLVFRKPLAAAFDRVPAAIDRMQKVKLGILEAELEQVAERTANAVSKGGVISVEEVRTAARIETQAEELGHQALLRRLDRLCLEYDSLRQTLPSGFERTRAMTRVLVQMRTLAPSISSYVEIYKSSGSPGSHLAAVAMMQMEPVRADIDWLLERFRRDTPFIFYHAALALKNLMNHSDEAARNRVRTAAAAAVEVVRSFQGEPDAETLEILCSILA
jgi:hypothetical protein